MHALFASVGVIVMSTGLAGSAAAPPPPGGITLLPGYAHQPGQGIDSKVGAFVRQGANFQIHYDIGRVAPPGQPAMGGDFRDEAKLIDPATRLWFKEQKVRGLPIHLAMTRDGALVASFPTAGANFRAMIA